MDLWAWVFGEGGCDQPPPVIDPSRALCDQMQLCDEGLGF